MSELFKIVKIDGKGFGAIALKDIPARGTLILREKPQLIIQRESYNMTLLQIGILQYWDNQVLWSNVRKQPKGVP